MSEDPKPVCDHRFAALRIVAHQIRCGDCQATLPALPYEPASRPGIPVQVQHAPINTANWQITAAMIYRFNSRAAGIYDPCIICGVKFVECPHLHEETEIVWDTIRKMPVTQRHRILNG